MRDLIYYVATTIDGQIAATDGSVTGFADDPEYLSDLHATYADALPGPAQAALGIRPPLTMWDAVVMGRRTYEVGLDQGVADPYPHLDQYVVSSTIEADSAGGPTIVRDEPTELIRRLKAGEGAGVWLCGGGALAASLIDEIDRLILKVNPLAMGCGVPLFAGLESPVTWESKSIRTFPSGVVLLEYSRP